MKSYLITFKPDTARKPLTLIAAYYTTVGSFFNFYEAEKEQKLKASISQSLVEEISELN